MSIEILFMVRSIWRLDISKGTVLLGKGVIIESRAIVGGIIHGRAAYGECLGEVVSGKMSTQGFLMVETTSLY